MLSLAGNKKGGVILYSLAGIKGGGVNLPSPAWEKCECALTGRFWYQGRRCECALTGQGQKEESMREFALTGREQAASLPSPPGAAAMCRTDTQCSFCSVCSVCLFPLLIS
jgi:hypothetical protein